MHHVHMSSDADVVTHTPAPRHTQRDTSTDGRTRLQMQQDSKQTHTRVWCPSFYSLALPLCLSQGVSLWSYDTLLLLLLFYACGDASLLVCVLYLRLHVCSCMTMHVWFFLYVSLPFAWILFLPPSLCC